MPSLTLHPNISRALVQLDDAGRTGAGAAELEQGAGPAAQGGEVAGALGSTVIALINLFFSRCLSRECWECEKFAKCEKDEGKRPFGERPSYHNVLFAN